MKSIAQSKTEYIPLSPLPGTTKADKTADLKSYLPGLFNIIIGLVVVVAVGRIIWGGIMYITTDSWGSKSEGKEMIKKAIYSLLLIAGSWIILSTINPKLFNSPDCKNKDCLLIDLSIGSDTITGGLPATGGTYDPATLASANAALLKVTTTCPGCSISNIPLNLNASDVERLSCTNCGPLNSAIAVSVNAQRNVAPGLNEKLVALNNATKLTTTMTITEGYPPTRYHKADCHYNGTCVDATIASVAPNSIANFISNSKTAGLIPIYEVSDPNTRTRLIAGGVPCANIIALPPVNGVPQITGPHFSIYSNPPTNMGTCP